ncbi:MAG TPA: glycoside hydrolase family 25 protein [Candidatus Limnocylindrales bacterium]|nr:glycoside hydrolase family 25 protein [Candidatus Limnocylindrales bacterium]
MDMPGALPTRLLRAVALPLAVTLAMLAPAAQAFAASTSYAANCPVNLRGSTSTGAAVIDVIATDTVVTASGTVSGGSWSATCVSNVSGSSWYAITAVDGKSASSLYGRSTVYAATGLFRVVTAPPPPPPPSSFVEGIDVSMWQGTIDYAKVKASGKRFVVAKATEGIGFTDPKWQLNKTNAMAAGLAFTGYHFARPDGNPTQAVAEADWFVSQLGLKAGMLVPALDLEVAGTLSVSALQAWVGAWLGEVYLKTGVRPMIYTSPSFWGSHLGNTSMFAVQGYKILWVAHWFVGNPTVPGNNWGGKGWTFWQYDDCGSVPGITTGCVDLDRYHSTDFTTITYGADFGVAAGTASSSVKQGHGASVGVALNRTWFTLPIGMTVAGLPVGATASISPASATGSSATLVVTTAATTPLGTYPLTVTGAGNGLTRKDVSTLVVTDGIAPTVSPGVSELFYRATVGATSTPVRTAWSASDPSGITSNLLQRSVNGGSWTVQSLATPTSTSVVQSLTFGSTYRYFVKATDGASNTSSWVYGPTFRPLLAQQTAATYSGPWSTGSFSSASGGTLKFTSARGAWAQYSFTGSSISLVAYRGPTRGSANVYVDGKWRGTINLSSPTYVAKQIVYATSWATNGSHKIRIVCQGTAGHPRIDVDAFVRIVQL